MLIFSQDEVQEMMEIQHSLIGQFEVIQPGRVCSVMLRVNIVFLG